MPVFTVGEPDFNTLGEMRSYLAETVAYMRYFLENLDGDNIPALRRRRVFLRTVRPEDWQGEEAPYYFTLNENFLEAESTVAMVPHASVTAEELSAYQKANILGGRQGKGSLVLKAWGEKPAVPLTVTFAVL